MAMMFGCQHGRCGIRRRMEKTTLAAGTPDVSGGAFISDQAGQDLEPIAATFRLSTGETLADASAADLLVLVFLRHFGCTFTRQILRSLEKIETEAASRSARIVLVHMMKSGDEIRYLAGHDDVPRIADPRCDLYHAFGLGNGGILALLGPRVWWLGLLSVFKGCGVGHLAGNGLQMPGAFAFRHSRIIASQRAKSAADLPDIPGLFRELETEPSHARDTPTQTP
jgi:hypothetical protein